MARRDWSGALYDWGTGRDDYQENKRTINKGINTATTQGLAQVNSLRDNGAYSDAGQSALEAQGEYLRGIKNWELARAKQHDDQGTQYTPSTAFEQATRVGGFPPRQVNNAAAPQQSAAPTQRTTGGGQAIAAENPDQQPAAAPRQTTTGNGVENYAAGGLNFARSKNERGETVLAATDGSGGTARAVLHGGGNQQQSRPGLGLNGMRDLGNGQVAVGQVGGFQNPGYGFVGNREDAERFFQPVGRPGGYNPYRVDVGPTLFNRLQEERRAAKATPQPAEQGPMGWQRLRDKMNNESRERIAEMTGGFGLTQAGLQDARAREQLAQQYGINMAQLGNDNLRTQAALGLSGLQQQQAQNQMAWDAEKLKVYQDMNDPRLSPSERVAARRTFEALNGAGKEQGKRNEAYTIKNAVGDESRMQDVYDDDGNLLYTRKVPTEQEAADNQWIKNNLEDFQIDELNALPPEQRPEALSRLRKELIRLEREKKQGKKTNQT